MTDQPNYFAIIPANVRYSKDLEPNAKLLYGEITALTHKEGYCWASNAYFASLYDVDERTVKRWISSLHERGFVRVEVKKNGLRWERKIYIENMFTKGQKCPNENPTAENPLTDGFQRRDKNVPIEGTKMSPYKDILNNSNSNSRSTPSGQVEKKTEADRKSTPNEQRNPDHPNVLGGYQFYRSKANDDGFDLSIGLYDVRQLVQRFGRKNVFQTLVLYWVDLQKGRLNNPAAFLSSELTKIMKIRNISYNPNAGGYDNGCTTAC